MAVATGRPLRKFSAFSFNGGLDIKTSPEILASVPKLRTRLLKATNVVYPTSGTVTKRPDLVTVNTVSLGANVGITGGFQFRHSNGTDYNIVGTDDGRVVKLNADGSTTNLVTGKTAGTKWYFAQYNDLLICCNRADAPMKYDGTTFGTLGGTPPATGGPVAVHSNRAFMLDATNTRRISWCALNNVEDWTTASNAGAMVVTGRLSSPLVFLQALTSELLLGHREFVSRLQGTAPATYAITDVVPAQVSIGGISSQGATFGNNDAWWISERGIHNLYTTLSFGDLKERFASATIDAYFLPGTAFTVTLNQLTQAVAGYDTQFNRLLFALDANGDGQNELVLVKDLYTGGWSTFDGLKIASLFSVANGAQGSEMWAGGYDGFVRRFTPTITSAINSQFTHISDLGLPLEQKLARHLFIYLKEQGAGTMQVTTTADFGAAGGQVFNVSMLGDTATLGSSFVLGSSTLGSRSQIIKRINCGVLCEFLAVTFANTQAAQPFEVNGYEVLYRPWRVVGRASTS